MYSMVSASIYDNRYFPFLRKPYVSVEEKPSHFSCEFFVTTASRAFGSRDDKLGISEIYGGFDQGVLADAMVATGKSDPVVGLVGLLENKKTGRSLPWRVTGKVQAQGFGVSWYKKINRFLGFGGNWYAMRANSYLDFFIKKDSFTGNVTAEEALLLDEHRRTMLTDLCLNENASDRLSMGDFDLYLKVGKSWDYVMKCKHVDCGIRMGALLPAALRRNVNSPASVPFGGNGHYGFYCGAEAEFELKDDLKVGLLLQANKRFAQVYTERMPALTESQIFGVLVGDARINPGPTLIFSPYVQMESLRVGLGARVQCTIIKHWQDTWKDCRYQPSVPATLCHVEENSSWGAEIISLRAFYDFGKDKAERNFLPVVYLSWDIPVQWLIAHRVARTYEVSLGFELSF